MSHGSPRPTDPGEVDPDHLLAACGADRPAAVALELDPVLGYQNTPLPARTSANTGPMRRERGTRAGNAERDCMTQRAAVTGGFEAQGVRIGQAVASVELEGDLIERAAMMDGTAPASRNRRQPVRQLMKKCQALIELVVPRADRDHSLVTARNPR